MSRQKKKPQKVASSEAAISDLKVSVVLPALNEAESVPQTIADVQKALECLPEDSYEIIVNQYTDSPKLPDAMYGLALSYQGMSDIPRARQLLNDIKRRFPNTGVANLADTRLLSMKR